MRRALLAGLLALGACSEPTDEAAAPAAEAGKATPAEAQVPAAVPQLSLTADGLMHAPATGGPLKPLAFGSPRETVESEVERALGPATGRSRNEECGGGPMDSTDYGELTLNFEGGSFTGWYAASGTKVPTSDGIRPGVTRRELERERSVTMIAGTTLDGEFGYEVPGGGTIGGFFDGSGPEAQVTALYAGSTCFFR